MSAATKAALTTLKLLASIKRRCMSPSSQITFTDADLIDFLNEELLIGLVPSIQQMKDEYFVYKHIIPISQQQSVYSIPDRAIGNKLRNLSITMDQYSEMQMTQVSLDDINFQQYSSYSGQSNRFYIQGSDIVLHPQQHSLTGNLNFYYYIRPNNLVKDDNAGVVQAIDRVNKTITLSKVPSGFAPSIEYDFVKCRSPHNILAIDVKPTSVNSLTRTITFASSEDIPATLQLGDYMCLAGETCIPNVPTELHAVLAQRVAMRVLEALGDSQGLSNAQKKLDEMESKTTILIDNRSEGTPLKAVNNQLKAVVRGRTYKGGF